jgi:hypothetical protein
MSGTKPVAAANAAPVTTNVKSQHSNVENVPTPSAPSANPIVDKQTKPIASEPKLRQPRFFATGIPPPKEPFEPLLNEVQVARILGMSIAWLQRGRCKGFGPPYIKIGGSVRYEPAVIRRYVEANRCEPQGHSRCRSP